MSVSSNHPGAENPGDGLPPRESCLCPESGQLSDRLLNAMQTSVVFFDEKGVIFRTNTLAREDLHLTGDPAGRRVSDVLSIILNNRDVLPGLLAELDKTGVDQVALPRDTFMKSADTNAQCFVTGCLTRLDDGGFLLSFRNVVDELTQEYMLKMALSSTKIFPWFYDMERNTMVIDPRYYAYTGIPTEDYTMTLDVFSERLHPDDRAAMAHAFTMQLNGEHYPYPVPFRLRRGDDTYEWFEGQSTYLGQIKGMPYRVVGICMSTQAHKNIEEALMAAKNKAEQSEKLKSAFLANMSHEIRTPLNAIVGFSNLLAGGEVDPDSQDAREYAELIGRNCDHLLSLVSDILDLSRIETGAMEYTFAVSSVSQLLSDIYQNYKHIVPENVKFDLLLPPGEVKIETDALRLRQVLDNLINNALKFTEKGHVALGCELSGDGRSVQLFVADTGRGIPEDEAERIFERFYKVDAFVQGAGLGLSLCKTIAECLGGSISVASRVGEGARFTLTLPLRRQYGSTI